MSDQSLTSRFDQLPLQHRNGNREIVAPGSQSSGKDRVGGVGDMTKPMTRRLLFCAGETSEWRSR